MHSPGGHFGIIGRRHWSVAQEGYKQMRKAFGVTAEG